MNKPTQLLIVSALTGLVTLGALVASTAQADFKRNFTLDVAMDAGTSGVNLSDVGMPKGTVVIVNGNIFPKGTLPKGESKFDPNEAGDIGIWRCHFAALAPGEAPLTGVVTYYFQLKGSGRRSEESLIIAQGLNSHPMNPADFELSVPRVMAIVGGTGKFTGASGEVRETVIGTNMSSRNLRFRFKLRNRGRYHSY